MNPISWQTYEFEHSEKSSDWFWALGIIGVSVAVAALIFGNVLFALLVVVATVAIILIGNKEPHLLECEINSKGIKVNKTLYPYIHLESFNLSENNTPKLLLKSSKVLMPLITIPLGTLHVEEVKKALLPYLHQDPHLQEPLAHILMEHFGF